MPELKPVETGPLPVPTTGPANPVGEAGTIRGEDDVTEQDARRWKPTASVAGGCHLKNSLVIFSISSSP